MCIIKNGNSIIYPCKICFTIIKDKDSAAQCDICLSWVHTECNKLDYKAQMIPGTVSFVAAKVFLLEHDHVKIFYLIQTFSQGVSSDNDKESSLSIKPSTFALLLNEFDNTSSENNNDPENVVNSK